MSLFKVIQLLESYKIHYFIEKTRPDSIRVSATLVGERLEIDIFENGGVEISRFYGDEEVDTGISVLEKILETSE